jgi:predicted molibdopterin-dependent oxidoreductase YjgC
VFGAGGGTSSYREVEETDVILLWGSNARETHPIFFHHVLKAVHRGARLYVIDPRRTSSAKWADAWVPLRVGTDIALANAVAHVIVRDGLVNESFVARATSGYEAWRDAVAEWTPARAEAVTRVPAALIEQMARDYARAERAVICWTLGITEHHNAVDNVLSLINLGLATGHVGRWGSGLNPLRGQNNVQGGGDMGALPHKLPGFQDVEDPDARGRYERLWGAAIPPRKGWTLTEMLEAMHRRELRALYVIGENPAQSEADSGRALKLLGGLDFMVVQDLFLTKTARMAHVVLPASSAWSEGEGTVTNSERRVQRVRAATNPPGEARDDLWILAELSRRLGFDLGHPTAQELWDEMRAESPMHRGMSYAKLEAHGGIQWPCPDEESLGAPFLHGRLWAEPREGEAVPFSVVEHAEPVDPVTREFPLTLTTGRRLDSYNTGVQTAGFKSPMRRGETVDVSPEDARALGLRDGQKVRVVSRRGSIVAPARVDEGLPTGTVFMTFHFPDEVDTNTLTIDATDPRSGTAEFKAAAVRLEVPAPTIMEYASAGES